MITRRQALAGLSAGAASLKAGFARAADFYDGKTISIICGYNPGGGVDLGTRLIGENIGRFIPGSPRVIVQNMEGAGGLIAANHLYAKSAPDGLTLAVPGRDWVLKPLLNFPNARFDPLKFQYIGSTGAINIVAYVNAASGVREAMDLKTAKRKIVFGGLPGTSMNTAVPALLGQLGWQVEMIRGYDSTPRIIHAMEQKELDGIYTPDSSFVRRRDLIDNKSVIPLFQSDPVVPGLPTAVSLVEAKDRSLMVLAHGQVSVGMPLVAPPGTPTVLVDVLRQAFMAMSKDAAFEAHARRVEEPVGAAISGADLEQKVRKLTANITPETVQAYARL
jgi:tripartite-type tricarboxylate transporter receptor subunit TctC